MQWFVKKEDVLGAHHEYEQMLDLNNFKIKLFVCKTYLDMQFSGFQNKENETNRSLTMLKLEVQKRKWNNCMSEPRYSKDANHKQSAIHLDQWNEWRLRNMEQWQLELAPGVFSCIGALVAGFYLLFLPGPMVNPGSGINAFIMEFPGFENSRQSPRKAKVMTKIRKTKRASEDML